MALKTQRLKLNESKAIQALNSCERLKRMRIEEYKKKNKDLDAKEKELCRQTNKLVEELVATCDDSPFHEALIKILGNLKGIFIGEVKFPYRNY